MGAETGELKDCPSCGSQIAEAATKCSFCKSSLGHCLGCNAWLVEGLTCFDCGKTTAVRVRKAAAPKEPEAAKVGFDGSPMGLIPALFVRTLLAAACLGAIAVALAASPLDRIPPLDGITWYLREHGIRPQQDWRTLWGVAGALLLAVFFVGTFVRRYRLSHSTFYGKPVEVTTSIGSIILNLFITLIVLALTAGLGLPWLYSRYRRSFYRSCRVGAGNAALGFRGTGEEVLGRFCLAVLLLPFGIATGGLLFGVISWMWLKWEQDNVLVPDRNGQMRPLRLTGTFGAYLGRWMLGWLISVVTAGIYRPWAKIAEWRWVAENSDIA